MTASAVILRHPLISIDFSISQRILILHWLRDLTQMRCPLAVNYTLWMRPCLWGFLLLVVFFAWNNSWLLYFVQDFAED